MVRCFEDDNVIHVNNRVDPVDDSDTINFELALSDVGQIERRLERLAKKGRSKEEQAAQDVRSLYCIVLVRPGGHPSCQAGGCLAKREHSYAGWWAWTR